MRGPPHNVSRIDQCPGTPPATKVAADQALPCHPAPRTLMFNDIRVLTHNVHKNWDYTSSLLAQQDYEVLLIQEIPHKAWIRRVPSADHPLGTWISGSPQDPNWTCVFHGRSTIYVSNKILLHYAIASSPFGGGRSFSHSIPFDGGRHHILYLGLLRP
jgi:hypothetical protein